MQQENARKLEEYRVACERQMLQRQAILGRFGKSTKSFGIAVVIGRCLCFEDSTGDVAERHQMDRAPTNNIKIDGN